MISVRSLAGAAALALCLASGGMRAHAQAAAYRFELVGTPRLVNGKDFVQLRLLHLADNRAVPDAVIFETSADMGPAGMATMTAPVQLMAAQAGTYLLAVEPGMAGHWAIHVAAKVQGEAETVRGSITADLVK